MLWFRLPEVPVIVAIYVPEGVPAIVWDDEGPLEPHPRENRKIKTMMGTRRAGRRLRFRTHNHAHPRNISVHAREIGPAGKVTWGAATAVTGAVVPTLNVTVCVPLPLICTEELDMLHVGAGLTAGVMAQLKFTVPENDPIDANARLKLAVCPTLIVWKVGEPEAAPMEKSGPA